VCILCAASCVINDDDHIFVKYLREKSRFQMSQNSIVYTVSQKNKTLDFLS